MTESKPVASAEQWLGRNSSQRRRLWERLNPRHRKQLRLLARALVLRQSKAQLPDGVRSPEASGLLAALDELERVAARIEKLLRALARKTPPQQESLPHQRPI